MPGYAWAKSVRPRNVRLGRRTGITGSRPVAGRPRFLRRPFLGRIGILFGITEIRWASRGRVTRFAVAETNECPPKPNRQLADLLARIFRLELACRFV
jgi:hypothetical protein